MTTGDQNHALALSIIEALGYHGEFPDRPDRVEGKPYPFYWWRTEMRKRLDAALAVQPVTGAAHE